MRAAAAVVLIAFLAGCARSPRASVAQLWDRVPSWPWSSGDDAAEEPATPKVTANTAAVDAAAERASETAPADDPFVDDPAQAFAVLPDFPHDDVQLSSAEADDGVAWLTAQTEVPPADQRIHDLKAALTADTARQQSPASAFTGPHPLRLRVDGLVRRAYDQLQAGQWDDARRTAQLAVDLSDTAALEFLPNEDRPSDLLREIDEQIEARRQADVDSSPSPELPAPLPQDVPSRDAGPIAAALPPVRLLPAVQEAAGAGTVAANFPLSVRPARDETAAADSALDEPAGPVPPAPDVPSSAAAIRLAAAEAPVAFNRQSLWTPPQLEPLATSAPHVAPKPPLIDEIEPLPFYRHQLSAAPPPAVEPVRVASFHWSDWLSVAALAALVAGCGLALAARRWWTGH